MDNAASRDGVEQIKPARNHEPQTQLQDMHPTISHYSPNPHLVVQRVE